jgi:hypothetical protein
VVNPVTAAAVPVNTVATLKAFRIYFFLSNLPAFIIF